MKSNKQPAPAKHVPLRTCVACRVVKPKREMVRLVLTAGGEVLVDIKGKTAGRGVYLCSKRKCWETGLKGKQLEQSLKTTLSGGNRDRLIEDMEKFSIDNPAH